MADQAFETFYRNYAKSLIDGTAAVLIGAGMSRASGFVDWRGLLRTVAKDLGLDVDKETDLVAVAQYHTNEYKTRAQINQVLIEEFTKDARITENHRLLASLPLQTVWTTNYDDLIERAFREAQKRVDVKISPENLATTLPRRVATVYKMHGDISQPHDAVLTKEDYETYDLERELFSIQLKGDLVAKTFLFLGFSFSDPNIDYILSRIRILLGKNQRQHYCILKRVEKPPRMAGKSRAVYEYEKTKQDLRINDLKRYSVQALLIDDYSEVTTILRELNYRSHLKDIFISGSAYSYEPMDHEKIEELARSIGRQIIERGFNLVSGFGLGIGGMVVLGAMESVYRHDVSREPELRPFPQQTPVGMSQAEFWMRYRESIISKANFCIFICGNKKDRETGQTVIAGGVLEEFRIAKTLKKYPIPVGASGHAARNIWEEVSNSLDKFYPNGGVRRQFEVLGDGASSVGEITEAIFSIIEGITGQ